MTPKTVRNLSFAAAALLLAAAFGLALRYGGRSERERG
jgi:hypothetical protein